MIVVDVKKNTTEPQWREFESDVKVLIAPWTSSLLSSVRDKTAELAAELTAANKPVAKKLWETVIYRLIICEMVGAVDPAGNPLPCTDEVKDIICECEPVFHAWVIEESKKMGTLSRAAGEALIKNLKSSHGGKRKKKQA